MGGFEMHQFRAIDQPLKNKEIKDINSWSSRFSANSHGIDYVYHYSSFKKTTEQALTLYFDAAVYFDGYGTRQLMFRLPAKAVNYKELLQYSCGAYETYINIKSKGKHVIIDMYWSNDEGGDWMDEGDFPIAQYIPLRREILEGDYRSLFLMWLAAKKYAVEINQYNDEDQEEDQNDFLPPVPIKLQELTAAQKELVDFFAIDKNLIKAAAKYSPNVVSKTIDYQQLIRQLPVEEKDKFLHDLLLEKPQIAIQLRQRLRKFSNDLPPAFGTLPDWETLQQER